MGQQFFAQRSISLGGAVLQGHLGSLRPRQQAGHRLRNLLGRQRHRIDQSGGQADQARVLHGLLHEITDGLVRGSQRTLRERDRGQTLRERSRTHGAPLINGENTRNGGSSTTCPSLCNIPGE